MMDKNYSVYQHINVINNKKYIGITKQNIESRWGINGVNYKNSPRFYNAILKYGWDNFLHEVIYTNLSKEDACKKEIELIKEYRTQEKEYGYNILEGGNHSSMPKEIREYMSKVMMGNQNGKGKVCSEEKKKKISEAQKGKTLSEEHRRNISNAKKGKSHKPISEEARKKIADKHKKKKVLCVTNNTVYESIQECVRQLNIEATSVCAVCKGKHKHHKNMIFQYLED
jgi:group I intron endonuclease